MRMDIREFHEAGLLYAANRDFFWPLGLALAVAIGEVPEPGEERPDDAGPAWGRPGEYEPFLLLLRVEPPDNIVDPSDELAAKAARWMAARRAAIAANPVNSPDRAALRAELKYLRGQITGRTPGYAGDHYLWTVQFNQAQIDRIDAVLAAAGQDPYREALISLSGFVEDHGLSVPPEVLALID